MTCPDCGGALTESAETIDCERCEFILRRETCGVPLSDADLQALLQGNAVGPVRGLKSGTGRIFSARLRLGVGGRIELHFETVR